MSGMGRNVAWLLAGVVLALAGIQGWLMVSGRVLSVEPREGTVTTTVLRFGAEPDPEGAPPPPTTASPEAAIELDPSVPVEPVPPRPRNVVLLVADGMGFAHVTAARARLAGVDGRLAIERFPVAGWLTTHAEGSLITDSAASAAAMATGHKTAYGQLAQTADGVALRTVAEAARDAGMNVGLITDSYLWDATPAAFVAHAARRDFAVIGHLAESGFEVLLGERHGGVDDATLEKIQAEFTRAGRGVVSDIGTWTTGLDEALPAVGLLDPGTIADQSRAPLLSEVTEAALAALSRSGGGFFLLVETEETDTGSHDADFDRMVGGVAALDAVAQVVRAFAERDGETLILVTADHETGGLTLIGGGEGEPLRIKWATDHHSAVPVPLFAFGPGAERFAGPHDNTEVATLVAELMGLVL